MKKVLKIIGLGLGGLTLIGAGFCTYLSLSPMRTYEPPVTPRINVAVTESRVARGEKIAHLQCIACHADENNRLTGKKLNDIPSVFGKVFSRNITQDKAAGIGNWTDGDIIYFLRTGIRRNGQVAFMPTYAHMAEEDIYSVVAWLRSDRFPVQPATNEAPPAEYSLIAKLLPWTVMKPGKYPEQLIPMPDSTDQIQTGKYLATAVADCFGCHSADYLDLDGEYPERTKGYFGGGSEFKDLDGKPVFSANLTFDEKTGIGKKYTREQFIKAVKSGVRPDGSIISYPMEPRPVLTDAEAGAIYDYLKTIPKLKNNIAQKNTEAQLASR